MRHRQSLTTLLLLTLSATAYAQTETFLLTPLGRSEAKVVRSAEKILGPLIEEETWEDTRERVVVYSLKESRIMFGRPIGTIALVYRKRELWSLALRLLCDSSEQARATHKTMLEYTRSRLGKAKGSIVPDARLDAMVIAVDVWRTRSGVATVESKSLSEREYWIEFTHKGVEE